MTPAEVALNSPRPMPQPEPDRIRYKGVPSDCVLIERNLQYSFKRHKDDKGGIYWVHFPEKKSNLTARVYPDLHRRNVRVAVFQQDWRNPKDTTKGKLINAWTIDLPMNGHWTEQLSKYAGRAITQSEKQPKCFCEKFLILRQRTRDGRQFFGCSQFPNCTQTATIGDYEVIMKKPYCFMDREPHNNSSKDGSNGNFNNGNYGIQASG
ncbi:MAG: hypothetical protein QOH70_2097 [Blastocatellia bacterium]|nr:hypothetical protein [Blastocatellia bacterium]